VSQLTRPSQFEDLGEAWNFAQNAVEAIWRLERRIDEIEKLFEDTDEVYSPSDSLQTYCEVSNIIHSIIRLSSVLLLNCELGVWERDETLEGIETIQNHAKEAMELLRSVYGMEPEL
jgi:hypothetical protein